MHEGAVAAGAHIDVFLCVRSLRRLCDSLHGDSMSNCVLVCISKLRSDETNLCGITIASHNT